MSRRSQDAPYVASPYRGGTVFIFIALMFGFAGVLPARADDGGIENVGGSARLMKDQGHIHMVAETVRAKVSQDRVEVDCIFTMKNLGPADTVLIGFPDHSSTPDGRVAPMRTFRSWVDGVEAQCDTMGDVDRDADDRDWDYWWTKSVPFAAGQTRIIRDHYVAVPGSSVDGHQWFEYILETGASWAGPIGSAEIIVTLEGISPKWIEGSKPAPLVKGKVLRWSFREFEPGSDDGSPATISVMWWSPKARALWEKSYPEK